MSSYYIYTAPNRDPLQPTFLPNRPWHKLDADFWGPLPNGNYIYVLIDQYSRYPIVDFTTSILPKDLVPIIDKVVATQGFPDTVKTDRKRPFNGNDSHQYQMYMKWTGVKTKVVTSEDPEVNRSTEIF